MSSTTILNNNANTIIGSNSPNSGCNSPSSKKRVTHNPYRFGMELQKQRDASSALHAVAADEHNLISKDALTPAASSTRSSCHESSNHQESHRRSHQQQQHFEDEDSAHAHPAAFLGSHNSYPISETPSYESSERSPSASEDESNAAAMVVLSMGGSNNSNHSHSHMSSNGYNNAAYFPNVAMMSGSGHNHQQHFYSPANNGAPLAHCEKSGFVSPVRSNVASRTHSGINVAFGTPAGGAVAAPMPPPAYYSSSLSLTPTNSGLMNNSVVAAAAPVSSSVSAAAAVNAVPMLPLPAELILGKSFPHAMPVRNKSIICKRFLEAKCINRNPNVAMTPCCQLGGACPFRHLTRDYEEPVPKSICKFHLNGACLRDVCPFFHGTRAQLSALHASGATMYRPSEYWCIVDAQDPTDRCDCARRHK